jgi:RHS repeat-associated protein
MSTSIFQHHPNTIFIIFTPLHHQPKLVPVSTRHTGQPESYYHGEGRVALTGDKPQFQYKLTDHLGNTMVLFEDKDGDGIITTESNPAENEVLQRNFYYAFGLPMQGPWNHTPTDPDMPYLYNGKELEGELGLGWIDYGARRYDAAIGRWGGVDPLAHLYYGWSSYNYVLGNPISFVDPDGRSVDTTRVFSISGEYQHTVPDNLPNEEHFLSQENLDMLGNTTFNNSEEEGRAYRLFSEFHVGANTRKQLEGISSKRSKEGGFLLHPDNTGELQVLDITAHSTGAGGTHFYPPGLDMLKESIHPTIWGRVVGIGHTHPSESFPSPPGQFDSSPYGDYQAYLYVEGPPSYYKKPHLHVIAGRNDYTIFMTYQGRYSPYSRSVYDYTPPIPGHSKSVTISYNGNGN